MLTVLVLEEDVSARGAYCTALQSTGHTVLVAETAEAARALIRAKTPDILVLDLMVGGALTTEVASYAALLTPHAQVVLITGSRLFPNGELFDLYRNLRWVLRKPVSLADLTDMMLHLGRCAARASAAGVLRGAQYASNV